MKMRRSARVVSVVLSIVPSGTHPRRADILYVVVEARAVSCDGVIDRARERRSAYTFGRCLYVCNDNVHAVADPSIWQHLPILLISSTGCTLAIESSPAGTLAPVSLGDSD